MSENIDKSKNYIRTAMGLVGPLEPFEILCYIERGMVQDNDEIFFPASGRWDKLKDLPDLYSLKPEKLPEHEFPELMETQYILGDKKKNKLISKAQKLSKVTRYKRLDICLPVRYKKRNNYLVEDYKKSTTVDLSFTGFSFEMYGTAFTLHNVLDIEIDMGFALPFMAVVRVVRVSPSFQERNIIGVRFSEVNEEARKMLVRFLRESIARASLSKQS